MPKKNTSIIWRRPQRSPSRPAGNEPSPNRKNAPTPYGIRSSQRAKPKSAAIAPTAVAKISRNMWSSACATLSSSAVMPVVRWLIARFRPSARKLRELRRQRFRDLDAVGRRAGRERAGAARRAGARRRPSASPRSASRPVPDSTSRPASASGSMTRNAWPIRGRLPSSTKNESASKPNAAPVSAHAQQLDDEREHRALGPAHRQHRCLRAPRPADRSSDCRPRSSAQPSGIGLPSFAATITLPRATSDSDRSITSGASLRARKHRRDRIGAEHRTPAAGRRHRGRRIAERQADHAAPPPPARR